MFNSNTNFEIVHLKDVLCVALAPLVRCPVGLQVFVVQRCFDSTLDTSRREGLAGSRQGRDVVGRVPEPRSECRPDLDRVRAKYTRGGGESS